MKKGDIVVICDGSYAQSVIGGKLVHENLTFGNLTFGHHTGKKYVVIEINCVFPITDMHQPNDYRNDIVIQDVESSKVVFIYSKFLRLVSRTHTITIDGKTIKLSHESFLNLKEQLLLYHLFSSYDPPIS